MGGGPRLPNQLSFGNRVPKVVGLFIAITVVTSLLVVFTDRHTGSVFDLIVMRPREVWHGQVWRLLTYAFVELSPLSLLFQCLFLYWFGRDLIEIYGSRRFAMLYAGIAIVAAIGTCLIALVDRNLLDQPYVGGWSLAAAMTIAWGLSFPDRVIRIYFIIPVRGAIVAWFTVIATVVMSIYSGWERYMPELVAEGSMLAFIYRGKLMARWKRARIEHGLRHEDQKREAAKRERAKRVAASASYLKVVESHDDDKLPPEIDKKLDDLLKGRSKRDRSTDN